MKRRKKKQSFGRTQQGNTIQKDLRTPKYRKRVVPDKKKKESREAARRKTLHE